jgi:hypothetical protein
MQTVPGLGPPPVPAAPPRRPRATLALLRLVLTAHLLAVAVQPVLAGLFLTGDVDAISVHRWVGLLVVLSGLVVLAATFGYVVAGRGAWMVLPVAAALVFAEMVQLGMGFGRILQVHVPLGVAVVVGVVLLTVWAWSPRAGRPRGRRASR